MKIPKSTVRLAAVIKECGQPEPITLWTNPRQDKRFQSALEKDRVLTIKQVTGGGKKDFGLVGFFHEKNVAYWVFPQSLKAFQGKRVIGIDYGVLKEPELERPAPARPVSRVRNVRPPASSSQKPAMRPTGSRFRVLVRCVSIVDLPQEVHAATKQEAREKALSMLAGQKLDFSRGTQSRKAVRVEPIGAGRDSAALYRRLRGLPEPPDRSRGDRS